MCHAKWQRNKSEFIFRALTVKKSQMLKKKKKKEMLDSRI